MFISVPCRFIFYLKQYLVLLHTLTYANWIFKYLGYLPETSLNWWLFYDPEMTYKTDEVEVSPYQPTKNKIHLDHTDK